MIALSDLLTAGLPEQTIAWHQGRYRGFDEFRTAICRWVARLAPEPFTAYALYDNDAYPFAVVLFALLHAGKEVWIAGNNRPGTATALRQEGCRLIGDWPGVDVLDEPWPATGDASAVLGRLNPDFARLVMFTSGSTGEAKPVLKRLSQLQAEVDTLERQWGARLRGAEALATVSHQHIYGLIFRVLWPLSAGRCFHSHMAISPEMLLQQAEHAYWIASPAHLKRLDEQSPWRGLSGLAAIFSSGGPLSEDAAQRLSLNAGQSAIEVYGSTETGGIAWRQHPDTAWTLFEGMRLIPDEGGMLLDSPYLHGGEALSLDDRISPVANGRFLLQGRNDRIVKVEEKRLSLTELERRLIETRMVKEAFATVVEKGRHIVAVALVLSADGQERLNIEGRNALIRQLRDALHRWFEATLLPRKWLFLAQLPLTSQGKVETLLLKQLLETDASRFPHLQACSLKSDRAELQIRVPTDLIYFRDHFKAKPLLPGVVQINWVEHFGSMLFPIDSGAFWQLEAIKFLDVIAPGCELQLKLRWNAASGKLDFHFASARQAYSSGRLVYRGNRLE